MMAMSAPSTAGRIKTRDIEQLQQFVRPWDVVLRQVSPGGLRACMEYVQVNGILLYREHWSHRILATGATPSGYFFFGGPSVSGPPAGWCGTELSPCCLAFGRSHTDTDFVTPDSESHICLLVPEGLMLRYLGEESAARVLPNDRYLSCQHGRGTRFLRTMERILDEYLTHRELLGDQQVRMAIEWQLLGSLVELLLRRNGDAAECPQPSVRYQSVLRAIQVCDRAHHSITVPELAAASGVSPRVLEMGFQEVAQITPRRFIRWNRMNRVRRELLAACRDAGSVTKIAGRFGVTELGRFAVDYKFLFGESPSATLLRSASAPPLGMKDLLRSSVEPVC
jgi:AraC family ethanolamine operon transcriptional activator